MLVCCYVDDITYVVDNKEIGDAFWVICERDSLSVKMKVNRSKMVARYGYSTRRCYIGNRLCEMTSI
jgi:hypothetical protein